MCARLTPCLCCEVYSKNSYPTVLWGGSVIWSASVSLPVCPCWCNGPSSLLSSRCCFSASCAWQTAPPAWGGCCCLSKGLKHRNMLGEKYFHIQIFFSWIKAHLDYSKQKSKNPHLIFSEMYCQGLMVRKGVPRESDRYLRCSLSNSLGRVRSTGILTLIETVFIFVGKQQSSLSVFWSHSIQNCIGKFIVYNRCGNNNL